MTQEGNPRKENSPEDAASLEDRIRSYGKFLAKTVQAGEPLNPDSVINEFEDMAQAARRQSELASFDTHTGLYNKQWFISKVTESLVAQNHIVEGTKHHLGFAILFLDIDDFRSINSRYGHKTGDLVIETVARRLRDNVRRSDSCFRWGGDEMVVVSYGVDFNQDEETLLAQKESLMNSIRGPIELPERMRIDLGVSAGLAVFSDSIVSSIARTTNKSDPRIGDLLSLMELDKQEVVDAISHTSAMAINKKIMNGLAIADGLMYEVKKTSKNKTQCKKISDEATLSRLGSYYGGIQK